MSNDADSTESRETRHPQPQPAHLAGRGRGGADHRRRRGLRRGRSAWRRRRPARPAPTPPTGADRPDGRPSSTAPASAASPPGAWCPTPRPLPQRRVAFDGTVDVDLRRPGHPRRPPHWYAGEPDRPVTVEAPRRQMQELLVRRAVRGRRALPGRRDRRPGLPSAASARRTPTARCVRRPSTPDGRPGSGG